VELVECLVINKCIGDDTNATPLVEAKSALKTKKSVWQKNDFQYGRCISYTLQCGTMMTLISPGDCTLQCGMWLCNMTLPPYWNSRYAVDFDHITAVQRRQSI